MWPYLMNPSNSSSPHPWLLLGMANGTNGWFMRVYCGVLLMVLKER
jgi:hypothetical protein